jgi:hypothetical protein
MNNETAERIQSELTRAVQTADTDEFKRLLKEYADFPPSEHWLAPVQNAAVRSGLEMLKIFVERYPQAKSWDLGHLGNPVGIAAAQGDTLYLKFLLKDLGLKANEGRFMYTPVLPCSIALSNKELRSLTQDTLLRLPTGRIQIQQQSRNNASTRATRHNARRFRNLLPEVTQPAQWRTLLAPRRQPQSSKMLDVYLSIFL